ncbi:hypothetical protein GCM10023168_01770 [Fodinibacter luteus]|uniref:Uncharacterized protein n=1 Tax=Fodinibacter luteus TaxID=552064 RepID=A0ABP8JWM9_9MICO
MATDGTLTWPAARGEGGTKVCGCEMRPVTSRYAGAASCPTSGRCVAGHEGPAPPRSGGDDGAGPSEEDGPARS